MKAYRLFAIALATNSALSLAAERSSSSICETATEFFGSGDFDGDGNSDLVIVDKESGKYRLGYQLKPGAFTWVENRPGGIKGISGFTIGKLLTNNLDALGFTSPDANQITVVDVSSSFGASRPLNVPFNAGLGPNTLVAIDIGGQGNTSLDDLFVASIYNSPEPNLASLLRNDGSQFPKLNETPLTGSAVHAMRLGLHSGEPSLLCYLVAGEKSSDFHADDLSGGTIRTAATAGDLPPGVEYVSGDFRKKGEADLLFYKPGDSKLQVRPLDAASGKYQIGKSDSYDLGDPIQRAVVLGQAAKPRLFIIFSQGEKGGVFDFDGVKAPVLAQTIIATNEILTSAADVSGGVIVFSRPSNLKFSSRYYVYRSSASGYDFAAFGGLPPMTDNDNITIPEIHTRLLSNLNVTNAADMKAYTNTIPGTRVNFVMMPIPGGEFLMGSPASEKGHKPDEGPQHKVQISPFWMGRCEVTWNEYELFMYPDEERRMRDTEPSDESGDKLADAVTHPSKPYVEMSFGMGKDGFPAISMTQHGANKYCQWLSAKTGQFYRLPTEAEWEYACRAGTTNTYFFGDDPSKLGEYARYEQNSDFKYQKVGKKKPNPWGLQDMCGNVVEWVLDQYEPDYYQKCAQSGASVDPWDRASRPYPHSVRGGSWDDEASMCRSAARRGSDRSWKAQDPQLPKSIWFHSDAQWVGFRIVRPLKVPAPEQMQKYWSSGVERD